MEKELEKFVSTFSSFVVVHVLNFVSVFFILELIFFSSNLLVIFLSSILSTVVSTSWEF